MNTLSKEIIKDFLVVLYLYTIKLFRHNMFLLLYKNICRVQNAIDFFLFPNHQFSFKYFQ